VGFLGPNFAVNCSSTKLDSSISLPRRGAPLGSMAKFGADPAAADIGEPCLAAKHRKDPS